MNRAVVLVALAGCLGNEGVIRVELATAPGSTLLDGVQSLRLELTAPRKVVTSERGNDGFDLAIELDATTTTGSLYVDGFDSSGALVATGASPRFSFTGIDAHVVIYMAAPDSVGVAPAALASGRSELGTGLLPYGAILVGGQIGRAHV